MNTSVRLKPRPSRKNIFWLMFGLFCCSPAWSSEFDFSVECRDFLEGFNGPKNYDKAFACFAKEDNLDAQLFMILNGEAPAAQATKANATALMTKRNARPDAVPNEKLSELVAAMPASIVGEKTSNAKISHCATFAESSEEVWRCTDKSNARTERNMLLRAKPLYLNFSREQKKSFAQLRQAFKTFKEADADFVYDAWRDAEIRYQISMYQRGELDRQFWTLFFRLVEQKKSIDLSVADIKSADQKLNATYQRGVQLLLNPSKDSENASTPKDKREASVKILRKAERAWLSYRNAWEAFALGSIKGGALPKNLPQLVPALLTQWRELDLSFPLGNATEANEERLAALKKLKLSIEGEPFLP